MNGREEFSLPLTVERRRCASPDTMEYRLKIGYTTLATVWRDTSTPIETAVSDLLTKQPTKEPEK